MIAILSGVKECLGVVVMSISPIAWDVEHFKKYLLVNASTFKKCLFVHQFILWLGVVLWVCVRNLSVLYNCGYSHLCGIVGNIFLLFCWLSPVLVVSFTV